MAHKTELLVLVMRMLSFRAENLVYIARLPEWINGAQNRSSPPGSGCPRPTIAASAGAQHRLQLLNLYCRVLALEVCDETLEFGVLVQTFQMWIDLEERPAGKTGVYGPLKPRRRSFLISQRTVDAGDFVVEVVRVAERMRSIQGFAHTLQGKLGLISPGV